jgi:hypothetical protein
VCVRRVNPIDRLWEWSGFDPGLDRLGPKDEGRGRKVFLGAKLGLPGALPHWHAHVACDISSSSKCVEVLLFAMEKSIGAWKIVKSLEKNVGTFGSSFLLVRW